MTVATKQPSPRKIVVKNIVKLFVVINGNGFFLVVDVVVVVTLVLVIFVVFHLVKLFCLVAATPSA